MKHFYTDPDGNTFTWETPDVHTPLEGPAVLATLLAVVGVVTVKDAANAVGLTADDLIAEAQAWAIAISYNETPGD